MKTVMSVSSMYYTFALYLVVVASHRKGNATWPTGLLSYIQQPVGDFLNRFLVGDDKEADVEFAK